MGGSSAPRHPRVCVPAPRPGSSLTAPGQRPAVSPVSVPGLTLPARTPPWPSGFGARSRVLTYARGGAVRTHADALRPAQTGAGSASVSPSCRAVGFEYTESRREWSSLPPSSRAESAAPGPGGPGSRGSLVSRGICRRSSCREGTEQPRVRRPMLTWTASYVLTPGAADAMESQPRGARGAWQAVTRWAAAPGDGQQATWRRGPQGRGTCQRCRRNTRPRGGGGGRVRWTSDSG